MDCCFPKLRGRTSENGPSGMRSPTPLEVQRYEPVHGSGTVNCVTAVRESTCVSGGEDNKVALFNYTTGQKGQEWRGAHAKEITKVIHAPKIDALFSASRDKSVIMYKEGQAQPVRNYSGSQGHTMVVTGLTINVDNTVLCTGSRDNSMRLWDVEREQCISMETISRNLITHLQWSPTDNVIAQCGEDKEVRIFDSHDLKCVRTFQKKRYIQSWCDIDADATYCLSCSRGVNGEGCEATLWDIGTTKIIHEFKGHLGHTEAVHCCRFLPRNRELNDGKPMIATSSSDQNVKVWDRDSKQCLGSLQCTGSGPLTSIAVQPDGLLVVSSFNIGMLLIALRPDVGNKVELQLIAQF